MAGAGAATGNDEDDDDDRGKCATFVFRATALHSGGDHLTFLLGTWRRAEPGPVSGALHDAHQAFEALAGRPPHGMRPSTPVGQHLVSLAGSLDDYSSGKLMPGC
jgi:hypothetical protein